MPLVPFNLFSELVSKEWVASNLTKNRLFFTFKMGNALPSNPSQQAPRNITSDIRDLQQPARDGSGWKMHITAI